MLLAYMNLRLIKGAMHCQFIKLFICVFLDYLFPKAKIKMFYFL